MALHIDPDRGEYAGALELTLLGIVSIKAIGIITTKMPDGSQGCAAGHAELLATRAANLASTAVAQRRLRPWWQGQAPAT